VGHGCSATGKDPISQSGVYDSTEIGNNSARSLCPSARRKRTRSSLGRNGRIGSSVGPVRPFRFGATGVDFGRAITSLVKRPTSGNPLRGRVPCGSRSLHMFLARRTTALFLLLAWCFAIGHLCADHAGNAAGHHHSSIAAVGGHHHEDHHHDHHDGDHHHHEGDHDAPGAPETHHHHEIAVAGRESGTVFLKIPLVAVLFHALLIPEPSGEAADELPAIIASPPDERRSGYLFVIQTTHPVRGPSSVA
jgi:hypothetical protein